MPGWINEKVDMANGEMGAEEREMTKGEMVYGNRALRNEEGDDGKCINEKSGAGKCING